MKPIRGIYNIKPNQRGYVATIGNFDGVHLGHQQVLKQLTARAHQLGLPSLIITFEPLPTEYFHGDRAPARLQLLRDKLVLFKQLNIDYVLCLHFNAKLAGLPAADFVKQILVDALQVKALIIGDDFRFGHQRRGDFNLLQQLGNQYDFQVTPTETFQLDKQRVGSSRVRIALAEGNFAHATELLGRPYTINGRIVYGDQRGRQLGFSTANILLRRRVAPLHGVYAVVVHGIAAQPLKGVANIGRRPTVDGKKHLLEVHLFDFNENIYGRYVRVEFIKKIRDEMRFDSLDALKAQIAKDVIEAKNCRVD